MKYPTIEKEAEITIIFMIILLIFGIVAIVRWVVEPKGPTQTCLTMYVKYQNWDKIQKEYKKHPKRYAGLNRDNDGEACETYKNK